MDDLEFAGQNTGEEVIVATKQNAWFFVPSIFKIIDLWLIVALIYHFLGGGAGEETAKGFLQSIIMISGPTSWVILVALPWSIYIIASAWFTWANTIYLLTNQRVIEVEQRGWFSRVVSEVTLRNILFISHKIEGPVKTLLNFGSIHIRASGVVEEEIVLANVSEPYDLQQKIVTEQKNLTGKEPTVEIEEQNASFWGKKKVKKQL